MGQAQHQRVSMVTLCPSLTSCRNIEHGLEQHIGWFYGICTFSLLFGMLSYPLLTAWIAHVLGRRSAESVFQLNQLKWAVLSSHEIICN